MTKTEFRNAMRALLNKKIANVTLDDKLAIVDQCLVELQDAEGFDDSNKGKSWTDHELRVILRHAPTKVNCIQLARAFRRGYGSIEQIFRWAATTNSDIEAERPDDAFIQQIKKVAKQVGWRAA